MGQLRAILGLSICVLALAPAAFAQTPRQAPDSCPSNQLPLEVLANVEVLKDDYNDVPGADRPIADLSAEAGRGDPAAMLAIGEKHREGIGIPRDDRLAAEWFNRAMNAGSVLAMDRLALMYVSGQGVPKDVVLGRRYRDAVYDLSSEGKAGDLPAYYFAHSGPATLYFASDRRPFIKPALYILDGPDPAPILAAAEAGNLDAMAVLANIYVYGQRYWGFDASETEARRWATRCADAGHFDCLSQLAFWKERGFRYEGPTDPQGALALYLRMADMGSAGAMERAAWFYVYGPGIAKNPAEAERWLTQAIGKGSIQALRTLADWKFEGRVKRDPAGAYALYVRLLDADPEGSNRNLFLVRRMLELTDAGYGAQDTRLPDWRAQIAAEDARRAAEQARIAAECAAKPN
jgi:TPR repeat protein